MISIDCATSHDYFHENRGDHCMTWRRNGRTQLWVTRPTEFRIPVKFGLYRYGQIHEYHTEMHCACQCPHEATTQ